MVDKYVFGVMSNKWELSGENKTIARVAMCLFVKRNVPIVVYSPDEEAFMPEDMLNAVNMLNVDKIEI